MVMARDLGFGLFGVLVFWGACAGVSSSTQQAEGASACRGDALEDRACLGRMTGDPSTYEAKEEVRRAESVRRADEVRGRLNRLRAAEEARFQKRYAGTSTAVHGNQDDESMRALAEVLASEDDLLLGSGSSVRALRSKPASKPAERGASAERGVSAELSDATPSPEVYLRSTLCLLAEDLASLRRVFHNEALKWGRLQRADLALAIVSAEGLRDEVLGELRHRRLGAFAVGRCRERSRETGMHLLRMLLPKVGSDSASALGFGSGLKRLRVELERRAGLPRKEGAK